MSDSYTVLNPAAVAGGDAIDMEAVTYGGEPTTRKRGRDVICGTTAAAIANVTNAQPASNAYGLPVRVVGGITAELAGLSGLVAGQVLYATGASTAASEAAFAYDAATNHLTLEGMFTNHGEHVPADGRHYLEFWDPSGNEIMGGVVFDYSMTTLHMYFGDGEPGALTFGTRNAATLVVSEYYMSSTGEYELNGDLKILGGAPGSYIEMADEAPIKFRRASAQVATLAGTDAFAEPALNMVVAASAEFNVSLDGGTAGNRVFRVANHSGVHGFWSAAGNPVIRANNAGQLGFFNAAALQGQGAITGSRGGNAALASLLTYLASTGLITDGTS